jgi:hypothetical protein
MEKALAGELSKKMIEGIGHAHVLKQVGEIPTCVVKR